MTADRLGIKIEGPVRIGIEPPQPGSLAPLYWLLLVLGFLTAVLALGLLVLDLSGLPAAGSVFDYLRRFVSLG